MTKIQRLTLKKPLTRSPERVEAQIEENLIFFYELVKEEYNAYNIIPSNIYNMDESPFYYNLNIKKVNIIIYTIKLINLIE